MKKQYQIYRKAKNRRLFGVRAEAAEALVIICSNSQSTECKKARKELEDAKVRKGQRRNNAGIEEDCNKSR